MSAGYKKVSILNTTQYTGTGEVKYLSFFCSSDHYKVLSLKTWKAKNRGVCLVTKITADVWTPGGEIAATPYTSTGTSYHRFAIIQTGKNSYAVVRWVGGKEDVKPSGYVEPTKKQK